MNSEVKQEEVEAILEAVQPLTGARQKVVEPRDFRSPRRLSRLRLDAVSRSIEMALPESVQRMATPLRKNHKLALGSVSETYASSLFDSLQPPFIVYGFPCSGRRGWLVWDAAAAAAACETVLSGTLEDEEDPEPRALTRTERRIAKTILSELIAPIAQSLSLRAGAGEIALEPDELCALGEESPTADTRRLLVHLSFDGPGVRSEMRLYLPENSKDGAVERAELDAPEHLADVPFALSVQLGAVEVSLAELMRLEVGDIIPLGVTKGEPVQVTVDERSCAKAQWGRHEGRLAIRIEELNLSQSLGGSHPKANS